MLFIMTGVLFFGLSDSDGLAVFLSFLGLDLFAPGLALMSAGGSGLSQSTHHLQVGHQ